MFLWHVRGILYSIKNMVYALPLQCKTKQTASVKKPYFKNNTILTLKNHPLCHSQKTPLNLQH